MKLLKNIVFFVKQNKRIFKENYYRSKEMYKRTFLLGYFNRRCNFDMVSSNMCIL